MKWSEVGQQSCSAARTLSVVGDRWTMLVVREAFRGARRFEDFLANVGASRNIVADRLRKLVDEEILIRQPYQQRPARHEYQLTEKGYELYPVLASLVLWGDRWMWGDDGPPLQVRHEKCGKIMVPKYTCDGCGEPVDPSEVRFARRNEERRPASSD